MIELSGFGIGVLKSQMLLTTSIVEGDVLLGILLMEYMQTDGAL